MRLTGKPRLTLVSLFPNVLFHPYPNITTTDVGRLASFKPTVDPREGRRRRDETTLIIRKNKKDEQIKRRRQNSSTCAAGGTGGRTGTMVSFSSSLATTTLGYDDDEESRPPTPTGHDIAEWARILREDYQTLQPTQLLDVIKAVRRHVCVAGRDLVVDQIIDDGIVKSLVDVLQRYNDDVPIMYDAMWALLNIASQSTDGAYAVADTGVIPYIVRCLLHAHPDIRTQAAWCLGNIAGEDPTLRDQVLNCRQPSAVDAAIININQPHSNELLETFVWFASNLCRGKPSPPEEMVKPLIEPTAQLLRKDGTTDDACMDALWLMSYLCDLGNSMIEAVMSTDILDMLMTIITQPHMSRFLFTAMRILGNFCSGDDKQTQRVIDAGILHVVKSLLNHTKKNVRKEAAFILSNIAAGTSQQISELMNQPSLIKQIIDQAQNDCWEVRKECIWVISNLCDTDDATRVQKIVQLEGLEPLCSILGLSATEPALIIQILDSLDKVLKVGVIIGIDYVKVIDEYNGVAMVEDLQEHQSDAVYKKAINIIETYFGVEGADENEGLAPRAQGDTFEFGLASPKQLFPSSFDNRGSAGSSSDQQVSPSSSRPVFEFGGITTNNVMYS